MPRKPKLKRASFSTWQRTETCPARTKYAKIDGLPDPSGPAAARGQAVHDGFEQYVLKEGVALPGGFQRWRPGLDKIISEAEDIHPEWAFSLTTKWTKTPWNRGKIRGKVDLLYLDEVEVAHVIDYKTGRQYPEHEEQLHFYATVVMHLYPWIEEVVCSDWYLDSEDAYCSEDIYTRSDFPEMLALWQANMAGVLARKNWPAKRNRFCKWCAFSSKKGGPCIEG